ncbi:MAG: hypothetical protein GX974_06055 [Clostridiales bacterium]|nr:hypothetical protein [Clostridiales bacterium]
MKCTYCGNEMETGKLITEGGHGLFYMPDGKNYKMFPTRKRIEDKHGIILDGPYINRFHSIRVGCCICKFCRKIVISY